MKVKVAIGGEPLDAGALLNAFGAGQARAGAVTSFTGLMRPSAGAEPVNALELQHYPGFTESRIREEMEAVAREHELLGILVAHRVGRIAPGEVIVVAAAAAAHRRAAFEALDRMMDWLKTSAPFWKREHGPDGARWIEPTAQDYADAGRWTQGHATTPVEARTSS